jgi:NADH-quinone oxidoreductase subunit C
VIRSNGPRSLGRPLGWSGPGTETRVTVVSVDEAVAAPADASCEQLLAGLRSELGGDVLGSVIQGREVVVRVPRSAWVPTIEFAKRKLGLSYFCFLSGLDWMDSAVQTTRYENIWGSVEEETAADDAGDQSAQAAAPLAAAMTAGLAGGDTRFQVFCRLASLTTHRGVTFKADLDDADPRVNTIVPLFGGANWHEREAWEMYGFWFDGHPNLRHIYLPTGFEGYPLRKDFPLLAREVKPWPGLTNVEPIAGADDEEGAEG